MPDAEKDGGPHAYSGHNWWECEVCHQRVSDILDARLRKSMLAEGYPEDDVDRMIAQAHDVGGRLRKARDLPPAEAEVPAFHTEWRVVGDPGPDYPPYAYSFGDDEDEARGFVRLVTERGAPWRDGPHLESRTVTETPWTRVTPPAASAVCGVTFQHDSHGYLDDDGRTRVCDGGSDA